MHIRNVIIDLGGVLIDLNVKARTEAFRRLGVDNFDEVYNQSKTGDLFRKLETGKINASQFRQELRQKFSLTAAITDTQIDDAFSALLSNFPKNRLDCVLSLKKKYNKVLLFSNTNEIHYQRILIASMTQTGYNLNECFDRSYYSFVLGMEKPNPEAFLAILTENGLKAEETVFVDDSMANVEGAKAAGLHGIHLDLTQGMSVLMLPGLIESLNQSIADRLRAQFIVSNESSSSSSHEVVEAENSMSMPLVVAKNNDKSKKGFFASFMAMFGGKNKEKVQNDQQSDTYGYSPKSGGSSGYGAI